MNYYVEAIAQGAVEFRPETLSALGPPSTPTALDLDRLDGMLLGLAIGDSLGNTTEGRLPGERHAHHGEIRDYIPNRHADGRAVGLPSDDTQLAYWTLEHILEHGRVLPERMAADFADGRRIFGIGHTVKAFLREYKKNHKLWYEATQASAGNGAAMRVAPVVIAHWNSPSDALWRDAILAGAVTHNDPSSIGACVAITGMVWDALQAKSTPSGHWWLERYCELARPIEADAQLTPSHNELSLSFKGPIWKLVEELVAPTLKEGLSVLEAGDRWYSGAFLLETIPSVLYILARHAGDPEEAIVRAVNDTKDNDTVAAIVGAVVGALHGRSALPSRWIDNLLGRTREDDDGAVFALIKRAREHVAQGSVAGRE